MEEHLVVLKYSRSYSDPPNDGGEESVREMCVRTSKSHRQRRSSFERFADGHQPDFYPRRNAFYLQNWNVDENETKDVQRLRAEVKILQRQKLEAEEKVRELQTTVTAMAFKYEALTKAVESIGPRGEVFVQSVEVAASQWMENREDMDAGPLESHATYVGLRIANDILLKEKRAVLRDMETIQELVESSSTSTEREWWVLLSRMDETIQQLADDVPHRLSELHSLVEDVRDAAESLSSLMQVITRRVQNVASLCNSNSQDIAGITAGAGAGSYRHIGNSYPQSRISPRGHLEGYHEPPSVQACGVRENSGGTQCRSPSLTA
eukprot:TRINITY_DN8634_c0_g1_i1.p1 TRINITY_DN8634_c0_g1~~TRINITY_DN8634_c0_g1_i1.p1  ORF type:complete len:322 (-),score=22.36 TRINITY_DN8634_c0_g1_i1:163-1128(-)